MGKSFLLLELLFSIISHTPFSQNNYINKMYLIWPNIIKMQGIAKLSEMNIPAFKIFS